MINRERFSPMVTRMHVTLGLLFLFSSGCNQPFDPRAPLQEQLIVYSILSTDREVQTVRVYRNYMPPGFDPSEYASDNAVTDANVTIRQASTTYQLRDTVLPTGDATRYRFPLHAYVSNQCVVHRGRTYEIEVQSPSLGSAFASVLVPRAVSLSLTPVGLAALMNPTSYDPETWITLQALIGAGTKGYVGRFFIDYEVLKGTDWVDERVEVPLSSIDRKTYSLEDPKYPQLTYMWPSSSVKGIGYLNGYYTAVISNVNWQYRATKLIFKRVVFQFLQAEQNLYNYYNVVHQYRDLQSMRLDEPIYSNVRGGVGLVGAYTLDSLVYLLPENFFGNRR